MISPRARWFGITVFGFLLLALAVWGFWHLAVQRLLNDRLDQQLDAEVRHVAPMLARLDPGNAEALAGEVARLGRERSAPTHCWRVFTTEGVLLAQSDHDTWLELLYAQPAELRPLAAAAQARQRVFSTRLGPARDGHRALAVPMGGTRILELCIDRGETVMLGQAFKALFTLFTLILVLVASTLAWWLSRHTFASLNELDQVVAQFQRDPCGAQLVELRAGNVVTDHLAEAFNDLTIKIQKLLRTRRELTDNLALAYGEPVNNIRRAILGAKSEDRDHALAGAIGPDCQRLEELTKDLLALCDAECDSPQWSIAPVSLLAVVTEVIDQFESALAGKQIKLELKGADSVVLADAGVLRRVISHLLDNAIKCTEPGRRMMMTLDFFCDMGSVTILDFGRGLSEDESRRVFDRFYRTEASRGEPGNGLGLSYCKAAVEAMGGYIYCDGVDEGCNFTIDIPLETPEEDESIWYSPK